MPRKQRFKPSRKPKAVGTQTGLATTAAIESTRSHEIGLEAEAQARRDTDVFTSVVDLGGESG